MLLCRFFCYNSRINYTSLFSSNKSHSFTSIRSQLRCLLILVLFYTRDKEQKSVFYLSFNEYFRIKFNWVFFTNLRVYLHILCMPVYLPMLRSCTMLYYAQHGQDKTVSSLSNIIISLHGSEPTNFTVSDPNSSCHLYYHNGAVCGEGEGNRASRCALSDTVHSRHSMFLAVVVIPLFNRACCYGVKLRQKQEKIKVHRFIRIC